MSLLDDLNEVQQEAAAFLEKPVMVYAGPGSGKTRVLTCRIAYLIGEGLVSEPFQVLALTFTNKAADEMNDRIEKLIGSLKGRVWAGTFHSLCHRILRAYGSYIGLAPGFTIVDERDKAELIEDCLEKARRANSLSPLTALEEIGRFKNGMMLPEQLKNAPNDRTRMLAEVFADYQKRLTNNGMVDFDDLLLLTIRLFQEYPVLCRIYQDAFPHILVDEYQDTNVAQMEFLKLLAARAQSLCAVADDDQSIYLWRGAQPENIRTFCEHFGAEEIVLRLNYRSPQPLLDAAMAVINHNSERKLKRLQGRKTEEVPCVFCFEANTVEEEAAFVASQIRRLAESGWHYKDIAVLFRTRHVSLKVLEQQLERMQIPYTPMGQDYVSTQEYLKALVDFVHVLHSELNGRALRRILQRGPNALTQDTLVSLGHFTRRRNLRLFDAFGLVEELEGFQGETGDFCKKIHALFCDLRQEDVQPSFLLRRLLRRLEQDFPLEAEASARRRSACARLIRQAEEMERKHPLAGLTEFLSSVSLSTEANAPEEDDNAVRMLTIHGAKGLEWPFVFIVALEEGVLPHYHARNKTDLLEEERRSFYVAMTRAKEKLFLSYARERYTRDGTPRTRFPSRFLEEIPGNLIKKLNHSHQAMIPK